MYKKEWLVCLFLLKLRKNDNSISCHFTQFLHCAHKESATNPLL